MTTPHPTFSDREWQVLALLANDRSNKEIAHELSVSVSTVEKHLSQIYSKLAVKSRAGAIRWYWMQEEHRKGYGNP
ncbi:MAG: DNA-binding response regulator [Caldilinea sp. CFX5]|nr:DNA-binding response regulator [Caldilinea sp. CFX5]